MLQYISSSIDVIINLKFEDIENKMLEKTHVGETVIDDDDMLKQVEVKSLRAGDKKDRKHFEETPTQIKQKVRNNKDSKKDGVPGGVLEDEHNKSISQCSDGYTSSSFGGPSCPKVYEEIIQGLEADIRKHIRMEHQLKLHIESVEDRIEELERD